MTSKPTGVSQGHLKVPGLTILTDTWAALPKGSLPLRGWL